MIFALKQLKKTRDEIQILTEFDRNMLSIALKSKLVMY